MTYGVSGVDWKHYKHPLPEHICDVYMRCWEGVGFTIGSVAELRIGAYCKRSVEQELLLTHGFSGVDWRFYKHPLHEHVYDVYMQYWEEVEFVLEAYNFFSL